MARHSMSAALASAPRAKVTLSLPEPENDPSARTPEEQAALDKLLAARAASKKLNADITAVFPSAAVAVLTDITATGRPGMLRLTALLDSAGTVLFPGEIPFKADAAALKLLKDDRSLLPLATEPALAELGRYAPRLDRLCGVDGCEVLLPVYGVFPRRHQPTKKCAEGGTTPHCRCGACFV